MQILPRFKHLYLCQTLQDGRDLYLLCSVPSFLQATPKQKPCCAAWQHLCMLGVQPGTQPLTWDVTTQPLHPWTHTRVRQLPAAGQPASRQQDHCQHLSSPLSEWEPQALIVCFGFQSLPGTVLAIKHNNSCSWDSKRLQDSQLQHRSPKRARCQPAESQRRPGSHCWH